MARYSGDVFTAHIRETRRPHPLANIRPPRQRSSSHHYRTSDCIVSDHVIAPGGHGATSTIRHVLDDVAGDRPVRVVLNNCNLHFYQTGPGPNPPPDTLPLPGRGGGGGGGRIQRVVRIRSPSPDRDRDRRPAPTLVMRAGSGMVSDDPSDDEGLRRGGSGGVGICDGCFTRQRLGIDGLCAECEYFAVSSSPPLGDGRASARPGASAWNGVRYISVSSGGDRDTAVRREMRERMRDRDRDRARLLEIEREIELRELERQRERQREVERERDRARERARELANELARERERSRERGRRLYSGFYTSDSDLDSL